MRSALTLALSLALSLSAFGQPLTLEQRLNALETRVAAVEQVVTPAPATKPATQPAPTTPVRCDTVPDMRRALAAGARHITTAGIVLTEALDLGGATVELIPGRPSYVSAFELRGFAELSNCTILTHDAHSIAVHKEAKSVKVRNVTFAPGSYYNIHSFAGKVLIEGCTATTMRGYWYYGEPGSHAEVVRCNVVGGSAQEALFRVHNATYVIEDTVLDATRYGAKRIALRGDSPGTPESPGGIIRRSRLVGVVGPQPLGQGDGGPLMGVDRHRIDGAFILQLPASKQAEAVRIASAAAIAGRPPEQIVRLTFALWSTLTVAERAALPKETKDLITSRANGLTARDVALTLEYRAGQLDDFSVWSIEDSTIVGQLQIEAGGTGIVRRTSIENGNAPVLAGISTTYPLPNQPVIVPGESRRPPVVAFEAVEMKGSALGADLRLFPGLTFTRTTLNGQPVNR